MLHMNNVVIELSRRWSCASLYICGFIIKILFRCRVYLLNYICQFKYGKGFHGLLFYCHFSLCNNVTWYIIATSYLALQTKTRIHKSY